MLRLATVTTRRHIASAALRPSVAASECIYNSFYNNQTQTKQHQHQIQKCYLSSNSSWNWTKSTSSTNSSTTNSTEEDEDVPITPSVQNQIIFVLRLSGSQALNSARNSSLFYFSLLMFCLGLFLPT